MPDFLTTMGVILVASSPVWLGFSLAMLVCADIDGYRDAARGTWARDTHRGPARWAYNRGRASYEREQRTLRKREEARNG